MTRDGSGRREDGHELTYSDYINVPTLLRAQRLPVEVPRGRTREEWPDRPMVRDGENQRAWAEGDPWPEEWPHDELLFIITHQTFELWFRQILHDLDDVMRRVGKVLGRPRRGDSARVASRSEMSRTRRRSARSPRAIRSRARSSTMCSRRTNGSAAGRRNSISPGRFLDPTIRPRLRSRCSWFDAEDLALFARRLARATPHPAPRDRCVRHSRHHAARGVPHVPVAAQSGIGVRLDAIPRDRDPPRARRTAPPKARIEGRSVVPPAHACATKSHASRRGSRLRRFAISCTRMLNASDLRGNEAVAARRADRVMAGNLVSLHDDFALSAGAVHRRERRREPRAQPLARRRRTADPRRAHHARRAVHAVAAACRRSANSWSVPRTRRRPAHVALTARADGRTHDRRAARAPVAAASRTFRPHCATPRAFPCLVGVPIDPDATSLTRYSVRGRAALAVACIAIVVFAVVTRHRGHHGDVELFRVWFLSFAENPRRIYLDHAADVNYGALGLLISTLSGWFARATTSDFHDTHKMLLAPWLVASAWLFLRLARRLGDAAGMDGLSLRGVAVHVGGRALLRSDRRRASVLPSCPPRPKRGSSRSRVLPAPLAGARPSRASARRRVWRCSPQPLAIFSLPAVALLSLTVLARTHRRAGARAMWLDAFALAASGFVLFVPDLFFAVPRGHLCHVWHVYRWAGPPHGEMVGNGAAIWAFLGWSPDSPSRDSFARGLTPRGVGLALFGLALAWITAVFLRVAREHLAGEDAPRSITASGLLHAGMTQLAMSLFLAGTHERLCVPRVGAAHARARGETVRALPRAPRDGPGRRRSRVPGPVRSATIEWHAFDPIVVFRSTRIAAVLTLVAFGSVVALQRGVRTPA